MKGTISNITPKTWTDKTGKVVEFWDFQLKDSQITYTCWQPQFKEKKVGDEIEFTLTADKQGNMTRANLTTVQKTGFQPRGKSPEELKQSMKLMVLAYAKDTVVVAMQEKVCPCEPTAILKFTKAVADGYLNWVKADD